jgi:hypothetical protein
MCLLLISFFWIAAVIAVNPLGDFPLNDDWAYGSAVRSLVQEGDFRLSGWTATNLFGQVLWGALFCLPLGFSFTALRVSTLVLGLAGILATYGLLREARVPVRLAVLGALVIAFNPIYFPLSFTFMSDVPFTALATVSSWLLVRGLRRSSWTEISAGLALVAVAILIRQIGLALPLAFGAAYFVKQRFRARQLLPATLPGAAAFVLQIGYQEWLRWSDRLPTTFGSQIKALWSQLHQPWPSIVFDALKIMSISLIYTGLFLFPFLIAMRRLALHRRIALSILMGGIAVAVTASMAVRKMLMPVHGNIISKAGIGPITTYGGDPFWAPPHFWLFVTFISVVGAILLAVRLLESVTLLLSQALDSIQGEPPYLFTFALVAIAATFAPLPLLGFGPHGFYDRYLIVLLPWVMLALVATESVNATLSFRSIPAEIGAFSLLAMALFAVAATHDYLSFNRARWDALESVMREYGIGPERVDGGFEFNGWYLYDPAYIGRPSSSWWWVADDNFLVGTSLREGYVPLRIDPVTRWLPWGRGDIIVQRRTERSNDH